MKIIDQIERLYNYIPQDVYLVLLSFIALGIVITVSLKGFKNCWRICGTFFLLAYIFLIYASTVVFRVTSEERGYNFRLFWSYNAINNGKKELINETVLNVLFFIPLGVLVCVVFRNIRWWQVLLLGLCISISIELLQFYFNRGFSELDDIFHNVLGCMIGYIIYNIIYLFVNNVFINNKNINDGCILL